MKKLIEEISEINGVKNVRRRSGPTLKIELFSKQVPGREAEKIHGDLRKISQQLRSRLEQAEDRKDIQAWNWIQKPEKKYMERAKNSNRINDRESIGHRPSYYTVEIRDG